VDNTTLDTLNTVLHISWLEEQTEEAKLFQESLLVRINQARPRQNWYEEACHGWRRGESVLVEKYPWVVGLIMISPVMICLIIIVSYI